MKNLYLILCIAFLFLGCEDEETTDDKLSSTLTATIEGEPNFVSVPALTETIGSATTAGNLSDFAIAALDAGGRVFSVRIEGIYDGVGTYEIKGYNNERDAVLVGFVDAEENGSWCGGCPGSNDPVVGQIEITDIIDNKLFATFSLTARNNQDGSTKAINGTFEITLN